MSNALTTAKNTAVAGYDDAGAGFEDVTANDIAIAFIKVAQALTPEVDEGKCKSGDMVNTVTGEVMQEFIFQPCYMQTLFVEWEPRAQGGGMVGKYLPHDPAVQSAIEANAGSDFGKLFVGENDLVKTVYVYGNVLDQETGLVPEGNAILSFDKTKLKVYKRWLTALYQIKMHPKPPVYAHRSVITTQKEKNDLGSFYNFSITAFNGSPMKSLLSPVEHGDTLAAGKELRTSVLSGAAKAQEYAADTDDDDKDEIPF